MNKYQKKIFLFVLFYIMLKYAEFFKYVIIPVICIYMHQKLLYVFPANYIVHIFILIELCTLKRNIQEHKNSNSNHNQYLSNDFFYKFGTCL